MTISPSSYVLALAGVLILGYAFSLVWLLKRETPRELFLLCLVTLGATLLRVYDIWNLPPGLNDDEFKTLKRAAEAVANGDIFANGFEAPILYAALFQAPVAKLLDSTFWGMRLYPLVLGILAVPVTFAAGRGLRFNSAACFVGAFLVSTLPWALFWGRLPWGGEIFFYQALLIAGIARIVWRDGGWCDVLVATLGLTGLLYEYTAAWTMIGIPPLALLLSRTWRARRLCLAVLVASVILWLPWLSNPVVWWGGITSKVSPGAEAGGLRAATGLVLRTFIYPEGNTYWISIASAAVHPVTVVVAALLGLLTVPVRRSLFLLCGFFGGLVPAILSCHALASTHRTITAYLFIPLAAAALFEGLPALTRSVGNRIWAVLAVIFCGVAGLQSWSIFTSSSFWEGSERVFMSGPTLATEEIRLPVTDPTFADEGLGYLLDSRGQLHPGHKLLSYETWRPTAPSTYIFGTGVPQIGEVFISSLPQDQIRRFGVGARPQTLVVSVTEQDLARFKDVGWMYQRRCSSRETPAVQVPALIIGPPLMWATPCVEPKEHVIRGAWTAAPTTLRLKASANGPFQLTVEGSSGFRSASTVSSPTTLEIPAATGDVLTLSASDADKLSLILLQGESPPLLASVRPQ